MDQGLPCLRDVVLLIEDGGTAGIQVTAQGQEAGEKKPRLRGDRGKVTGSAAGV